MTPAAPLKTTPTDPSAPRKARKAAPSTQTPGAALLPLSPPANARPPLKLAGPGQAPPPWKRAPDDYEIWSIKLGEAGCQAIYAQVLEIRRRLEGLVDPLNLVMLGAANAQITQMVVEASQSVWNQNQTISALIKDTHQTQGESLEQMGRLHLILQQIVPAIFGAETMYWMREHPEVAAMLCAAGRQVGDEQHLLSLAVGAADLVELPGNIRHDFANLLYLNLLSVMDPALPASSAAVLQAWIQRREAQNLPPLESVLRADLTRSKNVDKVREHLVRAVSFDLMLNGGKDPLLTDFWLLHTPDELLPGDATILAATTRIRRADVRLMPRGLRGRVPGTGRGALPKAAAQVLISLNHPLSQAYGLINEQAPVPQGPSWAPDSEVGAARHAADASWVRSVAPADEAALEQWWRGALQSLAWFTESARQGPVSNVDKNLAASVGIWEASITAQGRGLSTPAEASALISGSHLTSLLRSGLGDHRKAALWTGLTSTTDGVRARLAELKVDPDELQVWKLTQLQALVEWLTRRVGQEGERLKAGFIAVEGLILNGQPDYAFEALREPEKLSALMQAFSVLDGQVQAGLRELKITGALPDKAQGQAWLELKAMADLVNGLDAYLKSGASSRPHPRVVLARARLYAQMQALQRAVFELIGQQRRYPWLQGYGVPLHFSTEEVLSMGALVGRGAPDGQP